MARRPDWSSASSYFPNQDVVSGTLLAFGTYFIGFAARPIGAAIFGHYGDRIGRKATLIATLLCMGLATFAIAFVPTYASIGIWGAVILTVLRAIQGIGVGGEWGGSVLLSMEWSRTHDQRGLVAVVAAIRRALRIAVVDSCDHRLQLMGGRQFLIWGWRIPFALSIVLVGIGLWIRLGILETPVFQQAPGHEQDREGPDPRSDQEAAEGDHSLRFAADVRTGAVLRVHRVCLLLHRRHAEDGPRTSFSSAVIVAACVSFFTIPLAGHLSDKIGRKNMYLIGVVTMGLFGFLYFGMVDTAAPALVFIAIVLSLIPHDMQYGPQAALIAESFTPRLAL